MSDTTSSVSLDTLIRAIKSVHGDALDQLADAMLAAEHLGDVADHLIGHFVDQARRSGASWTDIGARMGVTKQAAQKRFVPKGDTIDPNEGFARFTPRARAAVVAAQDAARDAGNTEITPEHLILGLLADEGSLGVAAVKAQGIDTATIRDAVQLPPDTGEKLHLVPFSGPAKKVLELTFREALRLGHNYIGTEHLLLALLESEDGTGPLHSVGIDKVRTETDVVALLSALPGMNQATTE
ncbi:ATP-dependent Clp protease ATP-binding subunit [Mycobacterium hackensackense]|uniref:Clp protease N-terminal domain-containing protein n=1 Tax=Mycobacterium hackensackense TaxID=228909 RepID=UPI002265ABB3|nr:Clp protease N-terminal domain-containing protein [Mycobacterium hackensackense]MCV7251180.1 ATP-dependent Clp protease ATP-binding subunit [Mycobacterium hackensackense]